MEKKSLAILNIIRSFEDNFMRDNINFLNQNNISIFDKNGRYKGLEEILKELESKFENS